MRGENMNEENMKVGVPQSTTERRDELLLILGIFNNFSV